MEGRLDVAPEFRFSALVNVQGSKKGYAMRFRPTAVAWIDPDISTAFEWDRAQIHRLARYLGYAVIWLPDSVIPFVDQVRAVDVDAVIVPSPGHLDPLTLNALMHLVTVETVLPRMQFPQWNPALSAGWLG